LKNRTHSKLRPVPKRKTNSKQTNSKQTNSNPPELAGGGGAVAEEAVEGDAEPKEAPIVEDTTIFVEDRPISPRQWQSETAEETAAVVSSLDVRGMIMIRIRVAYIFLQDTL
jgi:hypothetical protein